MLVECYPDLSLFASSQNHTAMDSDPLAGLLDPDGSSGKESTCKAGDAGDVRLNPGLGRSPGGGNDNTLWYFAWKIPWTEEPWGPKESDRMAHVMGRWMDSLTGTHNEDPVNSEGPRDLGLPSLSVLISLVEGYPEDHLRPAQ